jgi:hypothetical protein
VSGSKRICFTRLSGKRYGGTTGLCIYIVNNVTWPDSKLYAESVYCSAACVGNTDEHHGLLGDVGRLFQRIGLALQFSQNR